jgi:polysaccharide biosynthesis protein PslH
MSIIQSEKYKKLLFLTPRFPYPLIGGDRIKSKMLLEYLAKKYEVFLVSFSHGGMPPLEYIEKIENLGIHLSVIPLIPFKAGLRALTYHYLKLPLEICFYTQPEFKKVVEKLCAENNFDLAISFFMRTAEYLKNFHSKKILIAEDCRTLYMYRSYKNTKNILQKAIRWWELIRLKKYEPYIVNKFDTITLVTNEDICSMKNQNPNARYRLLSNGVDTERYTPIFEYNQRKGILFTGKLNTLANHIMAQRIITDIFPQIKSVMPDITLDIAGAYPYNSILKNNNSTIKIHPNVPDLLPYLQKARVYLHPHNGATGIQNKIMEAMACSCPVVTTPTGIQGIPVVNGESVLIGKSSAELAELTVYLLKNPEIARKLGENARKTIIESHSWDMIYRDLDSILEEIFNEAEKIKVEF